MVNRLREIRLKMQLTQQSMAKHLGIGKSALSMIETGKASLSERNKNILVQNLNINPDWLNKGEGEMFLEQAFTSEKKEKTQENSQRIPLYGVEPNFGLYNLLKKNRGAEVKSYIELPSLSKCDGAINLAGAIIVYKKILSLDDVFWGEDYLLSLDINGEEYITLRKVLKSQKEDSVKLVSINSSDEYKDIAVKKIKAMALVRAVVDIR